MSSRPHTCAFSLLPGHQAPLTNVLMPCSASTPIWIVCKRCEKGDPPINVYRCTTCYSKLQAAVNRRIEQMTSSTGTKVVDHPAIEALRTVAFGKLPARPRDDGVGPHDELEWDAAMGNWVWKHACPSCWDMVAPPVNPRMPEGYAELKPRISSDKTYTLDNVTHLDPKTGYPSADIKSVRVRVISVQPVITKEEEQGARFRALDPPVHVNYTILGLPPPPDPEGRETWQLIVSDPRDEDEEPAALSLLKFDALTPAVQAYTEATTKDARFLGSTMVHAARDASSFHTPQERGGKGKSPANLISIDGAACSAIRVNRVSGPFGHIPEGESVKAYRRLACDPRVTGAVPRDPKGCVAIALQDAGDAITHLPIFYMAVSVGGKRSRATVPRHFGIPRRGFVSSGERLSARITAHEDPLEAEAMRNITRAFAATTYDGAYLLKALLEQHDVAASVTATATTLTNYDRHRREFQTGVAGVASNTRSHGVRPIQVGDRVFASLEEEEDPPSWTDIATVVCTRGLRTSGKVRVKYDDETILQDHPDKEHLPLARIRPDVCSEGGDGGVGRGLGMPADGEEDKDDPSSKWSAHVAKAGVEFRRHTESPSLPAPPNLLDTLLALGEYTTIVDVIYNHYDRFGNLAGKLIENKMAVHRGPPSLSFSSWTSCCNEVPPGALGFPRYKVATICTAMDAVELHELHDTMHAGRTYKASQLSELPRAMDQEGHHQGRYELRAAAAAAAAAASASASASASTSASASVSASAASGGSFVRDGSRKAPGKSSVKRLEHPEVEHAPRRSRKRAHQAEARRTEHDACRRRGCWRLVRDPETGTVDALFHEEGLGFADWLSRFYGA